MAESPSGCGGSPAERARLPWPAGTKTRFLFAGRLAREKGLTVLDAAWREAGLDVAQAAIALAGVGADMAAAPGWTCLDPVAPSDLRALYAAAHVLVLPSLRTATFREPWGLVVNEAMNRGLAVIASDAVGAAAAGARRHWPTG